MAAMAPAATSAGLYNPCGITLDPAGNFFIGDSGNGPWSARSHVRQTGFISSIAGIMCWDPVLGETELRVTSRTTSLPESPMKKLPAGVQRYAARIVKALPRWRGAIAAIARRSDPGDRPDQSAGRNLANRVVERVRNVTACGRRVHRYSGRVVSTARPLPRRRRPSCRRCCCGNGRNRVRLRPRTMPARICRSPCQKNDSLATKPALAHYDPLHPLAWACGGVSDRPGARRPATPQRCILACDAPLRNWLHPYCKHIVILSIIEELAMTFDDNALSIGNTSLIKLNRVSKGGANRSCQD